MFGMFKKPQESILTSKEQVLIEALEEILIEVVNSIGGAESVRNALTLVSDLRRENEKETLARLHGWTKF
jgi:hypothetical protein